LTDKGAARLEAWRRIERRVMEHFQAKLGAQNLPKLIEWLGVVADND
jgi:hypothetical protein